MDDIITTAFRSLDEASRIALSGRAGVPFRIESAEIPVPHATMWKPQDAPILSTSAEIIRLLDGYDTDAFGGHTHAFDREYMRKYLYMTNLRVAHLADVFRDTLPVGSTVLEIGSFFGSFAFALQRLGYKVTAVDRYNEFNTRFDGHVAAMENAGVNVVRVDRDNEGDVVAALPTSDAVIAMAVVEHIPHTPKFFLQMLKGKTRRGGMLAMDTPNVARYWNRKLLADGQTIFQGMQQQFDCTPPWEGHHREYTPKEMLWMMDRIGCDNIQLRHLDYNMLQFERIDRPHLECLEACINDPAQADTILVAGRVV